MDQEIMKNSQINPIPFRQIAILEKHHPFLHQQQPNLFRLLPCQWRRQFLHDDLEQVFTEAAHAFGLSERLLDLVCVGWLLWVDG